MPEIGVDRDLRALRARQVAKFFLLTLLGGAFGGVAVSQLVVVLPMLIFGGAGGSYVVSIAVLTGLVGSIIGLAVGVGVAITGSLFRVLRISSRTMRAVTAYLFAVAGSAPAWLLVCGMLLDFGWWWVFAIAVPAAVWLYRNSVEAN